MSPRPLIVATDVHLSRGAGRAVEAAAVKLVEAAAGHELVLAGDTFNLSEEPPDADPVAAAVALLDAHPALRTALGRHLAAGHPFTLLAGNHDAGLARRDAASALREGIGVSRGAPVSVAPWFIRRGGVHIEHGHLHDPDNAPLHPLAPWSADTEPLGVSITRQFLVPNAALAFAHAHETTPASGLLRAFRLYGARAPRVVARYFAYALSQCVVSRDATVRARALGEQELTAFARSAELDLGMVRELAALAPVPTHAQRVNTFRRLYLDRATALLGVPAGGALALLTPPAGVALALAGAGYLASSIAQNKSRYRGVMEARLRRAAEAIAACSAARLVVFGHTHHEEEHPRYVNTGAFGYNLGRGHPYLRVEPDGRWERRRVPG